LSPDLGIESHRDIDRTLEIGEKGSGCRSL
jgi:hypothetical protein